MYFRMALHPNCESLISGSFCRGLVLLTLSLLVLAQPTLTADAQTTQENLSLDLNKPVERQIAGGEKHTYKVEVSEAQYARVTLEQRGIDVVVRLFGIDQKLVAEFDADLRLNGEETAELIAEKTGSYRLEVEAKNKTAPSGGYNVRLTEVHPATDQDRSLEEARKLIREADRLLRANKADEARQKAQRALALREGVLGPDHPDVARAIFTLGNIEYEVDDLPKAETLFQRAVLIREKSLPPDHPELASSITAIANVYLVQSKYSQARSLYQRALAIREQAYGPDHPEVGRAVNLLAHSYDEAKDHVSAEVLYRRAAGIAEKNFGPTHVMFARALTNLAIVHKELGDYAFAEPVFQRALGILEQSYGETPSIVPALISTGNLYTDMGEIIKAGPFYERALAILDKAEPNGFGTTVVLNNLGNNYLYQGQYEKAEPLFQRALTLREKIHGPENPRVALCLNNFADLRRAQGEYTKAESLYRRAMEIVQKAFGAESAEMLRPLKGLALLYWATGDAVQSVSFQSRANVIAERYVTYNLVAGSERQKLAYLNSLSEDADRSLSLHIQTAADNLEARTLAATAVLQRKGRVLDWMTDSLAVLRRRFTQEDQAQIDKLNEVSSQLANLVLSGPQGMPLAEHREKIKALEEERESLETAMSRRSAGFYQSLEPVTLATVKAAIPPTSALIEFALYRPFDPKAKLVKDSFGPPRYVAYVIRAKDEVQWKELGEARVIDKAIEDLRKALGDPKRRDVQKHARNADEMIMRPLRSVLGGSTQLLISPEGALNLLPFEALVDERGRYLVESFSCTYLTSGRDLLRLQVARSSKNPAAVFANPQFGEPGNIASARLNAPRPETAAFDRNQQRTGKRQSVTSASDLSSVYFAPLSGTAQEAQAIKSLLPDASVLMQAQATESSLKRVSAPKILHIATHGFFLTGGPTDPVTGGEDKTRGISANVRIENPLLRSGLALAGANLHGRGDDDGILTALEATGLNLWGTKLVTLSACDTGLGEVRNGEGVYGLRRAFVLAGTESLVMSLWPVSDYVTRELMTNYYKGLKQGQGRAEALRNVQLAMLSRKERRHPFYWASFIQSGEWANLDGKR